MSVTLCELVCTETEARPDFNLAESTGILVGHASFMLSFELNFYCNSCSEAMCKCDMLYIVQCNVEVAMSVIICS